MPTSTLTHDEAIARSARIADLDYQVHLDLTGLAEGSSFRSRTVVTFTATAAPRELWLDLAAARVEHVTCNGQSWAPSELVEGSRVWLPALDGPAEVVVEAVHDDTAANCGLTRSVDAADGAVYAWTQMQPFFAHRVFACFDQPDLKAPFRITVRAPASWSCVSNGRVVSTSDADQGSRDWAFSATPPLATSVIAVCAGPFHRVEDTAGDLPLGIHVRRSLAAHVDRPTNAPELFALTRAGLDFFADAFGSPYAGDSYDYVFLADFGGAMENFGCVTWADAVIHRSEPTRAQRQRRAIVLLHEMAHMWFGNLVTMRWWDGLWLNESFADWAAFHAAASITEFDDAWVRFATGHKRRGHDADLAPTTHPVARDIPDLAAAEGSFDMITYAKGASVLQQLVAAVGVETFLAGLRRYFARFAWSSTDLADLLAELEVASGRDLATWSGLWIETAGMNLLRLEATTCDGRYTDVAILQSPVSGADVLRPHRIALGVYEDESGQLVGRDVVDVEVTGARTAVPELLGRPAAAVLLLDDRHETFAKIRLDDASTRIVLDRGEHLPSSMARTVATTVVWDMTVDGEVPATETIDFLCRVIRTATEVADVDDAVTMARTCLHLYTPLHDLPRLEDELGLACQHALAEQEVGSPGWQVLAGAIASTAGEGTASMLTTMLDSLGSDRQALRWQALGRLVALGLAGEQQVADEQARDPDPDAGSRADATRAAAATDAAKQAALDRVFDSRSVSASELRSLGDALWQPRQHDLLRSHAAAFLDRLPRLMAEAGWVAVRDVVLYAFPSAGMDDELIQRTRRMAEDPTWPPVVANGLRDQAHRLAVAAHARGRHATV